MTITHAHLIAELERRQRLQTTMAAYATAVIDVVPAAHHLMICAALEDLVADRYDDLIVNTPPGSAKALALDTPVPTPHGWVTMGELRIGDSVFDENGQPCEVTWVSPIHRARPVYAVTTDCGDTIIADRDHEWLVRLCGKKPVFRIRETHFLHKKRSKRPMITRAAALDLPDTFLPIDPYLLGVWLGDGTSASMSITSSDEDQPWLRAELHRLGYVTTDRAAKYLFGVSNVRHLFTFFGLINDPAHSTHGRKHIPAPYLRASRQQRLALLQGLIDTDGTVCKKRGCTTFCNTNLELALQVRELVRSLGVKAGWSESRAKLNGIDHGPAYKVSFYLQGSARLPRKAVLTRNQYRTPDTYIEVLPAGTADTICIEVNSQSHLFLCGRSMTPTHNSTYVSHVLPAWYMGRFPKNNVIIASHTASLAEKWSRRVRDTVAGPEHALIFPDSKLSTDSTAVTRWTTSSGGECLAAGVGMSILGFRSDLNVIDDPVSGWEQAQSMTQLQKIHDWYKSDLKSRMKPRAKQVLVCQRLSANDLAGFMIAAHAENPTRRLRVINLPMVADSPDDPLGRQIGDILWPEWYSPEMVKDLQSDDFIWRTMYQQKPPSESGAWVTTDEIQFRPSPVLTPDSVVYGATDLALSVNTGDYTVHALIAIDQNGDWDIIHCERARTDTNVSAGRIITLTQTYHPREWLIDDDNASKVFVNDVAARARSSSTPVPWKPMPMRGQDKETRAAALRGQYKRRRIYMPDDAPWTHWLTRELMSFPNAIGSGVDDGVDTLGLFGRRLMSIGQPSAKIAATPRPTTSEMTLDGLWATIPKRSQRF